MKRKVIIFALAATLLLSVTALGATTARKTIDVDYGVKVIVNGEEATFKDAAGNIVEPFAYNGTTYVPIRGVSETLGATVDYDADAGAATIDSTVALHAITAMNCYKDIEDLAELADDIMDYLASQYGNILNGNITVVKISDELYKIATDRIPSLDEKIREMEVAIKGLRETTDSSYLRDSLADASSYLETMRLMIADMTNATMQVGLVNNNRNNQAYHDNYFTYRTNADDAIFSVYTGASERYDDMYKSARILVGELGD